MIIAIILTFLFTFIGTAWFYEHALNSLIDSGSDPQITPTTTASKQ